MTDIWHFPRTKQANKIIDGMKLGLLERVSFFAIRKSGKTAFVLKDLLPLAEKEGWQVIYVDFWDNKSNPEEAFVQSSLKCIKRDNQETRCTKLADIFRLIDSQDKPVLFLLDEVQHLASSPQFDHFTSSLRSNMLNRVDTRIKAVFIGSCQDDMFRLFKDRNAPFSDSAQTYPFTPQGESFVKHELNVFKQVTQGQELDMEYAIQIFKVIDCLPGRFVELLKQMALNQVYCIRKGHELFMPTLLDA